MRHQLGLRAVLMDLMAGIEIKDFPLLQTRQAVGKVDRGLPSL
ncbi:MAG: hypothetical protein V7K88_00375 [Nostoc sp.]